MPTETCVAAPLALAIVWEDDAVTALHLAWAEDRQADVTTDGGRAMLETGVPVGFGVLTTDNLEQAIERAGSKAGNKGAEASAAVLEMVRVLEQL